MNEELLLKYITGQATEGEKIRILNWLEEHPDNRLKFNRLKNTWVISKLPETKAPEASVLQYSRKIRHRKQNRRILGYGIAASSNFTSPVSLNPDFFVRTAQHPYPNK